jgi:predicted lactoylglutathione lyase
MSSLLFNIDVPNLDAAIKFYTTGLGFGLKRTLFDRSVAELTLGAAIVYLIEQDDGLPPFPEARSPRTFERHWTPVHFDVVIDDTESAVSKALQAGAKRSGETTTHSWGMLTPLSDPFGHGFCLLEFSNAGYDPVAD